MYKFIIAVFMLALGGKAIAQPAVSAHMKVDSLVSALNEESKKSLKAFYKDIFAMDSLAIPGLLDNMGSRNSILKNSVLSHALVYVSKENILNQIVDADGKTDDSIKHAILVYTLLGIRYKFNEKSTIGIMPNKKIFPILIRDLTDTLDISPLTGGIRHNNEIAWLAIKRWGEFDQLKDILKGDLSAMSLEKVREIQKELLKWWNKAGNKVTWDNKLRLFTIP